MRGDLTSSSVLGRCHWEMPRGEAVSHVDVRVRELPGRVSAQILSDRRGPVQLERSEWEC